MSDLKWRAQVTQHDKPVTRGMAQCTVHFVFMTCFICLTPNPQSRAHGNRPRHTSNALREKTRLDVKTSG